MASEYLESIVSSASALIYGEEPVPLPWYLGWQVFFVFHVSKICWQPMVGMPKWSLPLLFTFFVVSGLYEHSPEPVEWVELLGPAIVPITVAANVSFWVSAFMQKTLKYVVPCFVLFLAHMYVGTTDLLVESMPKDLPAAHLEATKTLVNHVGVFAVRRPSAPVPRSLAPLPCACFEPAPPCAPPDARPHGLRAVGGCQVEGGLRSPHPIFDVVGARRGPCRPRPLLQDGSTQHTWPLRCGVCCGRRDAHCIV